MRKITKEATNAFVSGLYYKKDNTEVKNIDDGMMAFYLHGSCIATLKNGQLYISHCGYKTNTTKERLNGILNAFNLGRIYQKDFNWYIDKKEFDNAFFNVK